ncbi:MAG TPA: hypothetical protein VFB42_05465 [Gaiellaceae bacterium]|nr:hypothetical protein [Gaiellaceae bacterium]
MRLAAAAVFAALLTAAPAAAVTGGYGISSRLHAGLPPAAAHAAAVDRARSCQAGKEERAAPKAGLLGGARRHAVVACEQPPKSSLLTPDEIAKATAAALAALG